MGRIKALNGCVGRCNVAATQHNRKNSDNENTSMQRPGTEAIRKPVRVSREVTLLLRHIFVQIRIILKVKAINILY